MVYILIGKSLKKIIYRIYEMCPGFIVLNTNFYCIITSGTQPFISIITINRPRHISLRKTILHQKAWFAHYSTDFIFCLEDFNRTPHSIFHRVIKSLGKTVRNYNFSYTGFYIIFVKELTCKYLEIIDFEEFGINTIFDYLKSILAIVRVYLINVRS